MLHIELRRWADALIIAPLSANSLAKLACGLSDNLLTCIVRAWDFHRPLLVSWSTRVVLCLLMLHPRVTLMCCGASRECLRVNTPAGLKCRRLLHTNLLYVLQVAPAMNTFMWESRFTQQHVDVLQSMGIIHIPPVVKRLACGEDGMGAMASTDDIAHTVEDAIQNIDFSRLDRR